jgi:predicted NodU family carbamoyl transferase
MTETKRPDLSRKRLSVISLSDQCKQVILGSLLGDGCLTIQKGYKNARMQIRHSILQEDYLRWKFEVLSEIAPERLQVQKPDGYSKNQKIGFISNAMSQLTEIHQVVCKTNKLNIKRSWLNHITELGLLIWWLDDGSIIGSGREGVLCTDGFDLPAIKILQNYLHKVWKINTKIGRLSRKRDDQRNYTKDIYYRLYLNNTELQKLFHLIMPFMKVSTMIKKMALKYKDTQSQQRWISEMKNSMPTMHTAIDTFYDSQKDIASHIVEDHPLLPLD